ncbi:MAG: hypothetical protein AAGA31_12950, partial [Bacteroidota bacterium]
LIINVANEPWFDNQERIGFASLPTKATQEWIGQVSEWIIKKEAELPKQHLLAIDYCNEGEFITQEKLDGDYQNISVFNHHYDREATSAKLNYGHLDRVLGFNETGLMDPFSDQYRIQAWKYFMCGGALYNNLDFTFQTGFEDGTGSTYFTCGANAYYGCTNQNTKHELASLLRFWHDLDFINMQPRPANLLLNYGHFKTYAFST